MELQLSILNNSDTPIYRQLYDQIAFQVIRGELTGGYCLPPIRQVALQLGISVISIKRAWDELERDGIITTMVGRGCFIADLSIEELEEKRAALALEQLEKSAAVYRSLGMSAEDVIRLVKENYRK